VLASLQTGNAELVDPAAVPTSRVAPRPLRTAIIAWLVCLMAVVVGASLLERYDRRLSSIADMEAAFGLSVLGDIPQSRALSWTGEDSGQAPPGPREREAFRSLRTNLRYLTLDSDLRTILITSAASRQGKTTVAIHLAQAFADGGAKVLLVEGDLRRPTLRRRLKLGASTTLVGAVIDRVPLRNAVTLPLPQDATRYTADAQETTPRRPGAVDVLPAGEAPTNPVQVLESRAFSELIDEARSRYDLVIIDGPPVLGLGDFAPLSRLADGAVFVARLDSTTTAQASALSQQVRLVGANVLGLVVNGTRGAGPDYLYLSAQADQPRKSAV
jgi:Mrp family chromosome partitioning ATPase